MKKYTIEQFRADYPNDDACLDKIFKLRFTNLVCPKCENDKPFNRVKGRRAYQCPCCSYQIYPTKDTPFEKSTTPLHYWFLIMFMQTTTRNGVAAKEVERTLNVCYKTALRMVHQVKKLMADKRSEQFFGFCELDEAFIGANPKYLKNKKREQYLNIPFKSGTTGKTVVFGILDRDGRVYSQVIPAASSDYVEPIIKNKVSTHSKICTDSSNIYFRIQKDYVHDTVSHVDREWVRGKWHTQNIESYWNVVKRTIKGTHVSVSVKHMQKYLDEISFRWERRNRQDEMFDEVLANVVSFNS